MIDVTLGTLVCLAPFFVLLVCLWLTDHEGEPYHPYGEDHNVRS